MYIYSAGASPAAAATATLFIYITYYCDKGI